VGQIILAAHNADHETRIDTLEALSATATGAWTDYTPSCVASAGTFAIGNGQLSGRRQVIGKTCRFSVMLVAGTTTTFGTAGAYWTIGLPPVGNALRHNAFALRMLDAATLEYAGFASVAAGTAVVELFKPVSGRILNNSPWTFGNADALWFNGEYELA
jgi:hypothetical protein